jgi:hypothetical protein
MKKLFLLFTFITLSLISQNEKYDNYNATVIQFRKIDSDKKYQKFDTLVENTTRIINLAKDQSEFKIGFTLDTEVVVITYLIKSRNVIKYENDTYISYLGYDTDGFPLILSLSTDKKKVILYYYFTISINSFSKSEKLEIK